MSGTEQPRTAADKALHSTFWTMGASAGIPLERREEFTQMGMRLLLAELRLVGLAIEAEAASPSREEDDKEAQALIDSWGTETDNPMGYPAGTMYVQRGAEVGDDTAWKWTGNEWQRCDPPPRPDSGEPRPDRCPICDTYGPHTVMGADDLPDHRWPLR